MRVLIRDYGTGSESFQAVVLSPWKWRWIPCISRRTGLDSAKITADIKAGMLAWKAKEGFLYKRATNHFKHSRHKVRILGGDRINLGTYEAFETAQYDTLLAELL